MSLATAGAVAKLDKQGAGLVIEWSAAPGGIKGGSRSGRPLARQSKQGEVSGKCSDFLNLLRCWEGRCVSARVGLRRSQLPDLGQLVRHGMQGGLVWTHKESCCVVMQGDICLCCSTPS